MAPIREFAKDEMGIMAALSAIAIDLRAQALTLQFDSITNEAILQRLAAMLISKKKILSYEFNESKILEALTLYLCKGPEHAAAIVEEQKSGVGEEMKAEEAAELQKKKEQPLSKKEAKCIWYRFTLFTSVMLTKKEGVIPVVALVNLCMEQLSGCEDQLFKTPGREKQQDPGLSYYGHYGSFRDHMAVDLS